MLKRLSDCLDSSPEDTPRGAGGSAAAPQLPSATAATSGSTIGGEDGVSSRRLETSPPLLIEGPDVPPPGVPLPSFPRPSPDPYSAFRQRAALDAGPSTRAPLASVSEVASTMPQATERSLVEPPPSGEAALSVAVANSSGLLAA